MTIKVSDVASKMPYPLYLSVEGADVSSENPIGFKNVTSSIGDP